MREINFDKITQEELIDIHTLTNHFRKYLTETLEYEENEADMIITEDFSDPYDTEFIMQEYEGDYKIGEKSYEVYSCKTDFGYVGMWHLTEFPPFEFYMLIDTETMPDQTVGAYQNAEKMYIL